MEQGKPLIFGASQNKGIKLDGFKPIIVEIGTNASADANLVAADTENRDFDIVADNNGFVCASREYQHAFDLLNIA